jgi:hypothetical protein
MMGSETYVVLHEQGGDQLVDLEERNVLAQAGSVASAKLIYLSAFCSC